jgi:hypothetical protein
MLAANPTTRSAPLSKSVPVSDLRVRCVSVFSSPDLFPFNSKLLALFILSPERSVVEGSTFNPFNPKSLRIRIYKKTGGGGPWHGLQSVLHTHYRASAAKSPAQRAGIRATLIPSCAYFITCGHPGWGVSAAPRCKVSACSAPAFTPTRSGRFPFPFFTFDFSTICNPPHSQEVTQTPTRQKC